MNDNLTLINLTDKILTFLKNNPEGVSQDKLTTEIPFKENEIVECLNNLISNNRVSIIDTSEGALFKYRSEKEALKFRDLSKEDIAAYEIIIQSGNNGVSTNEIKSKLRIDNTQYINKILNKLSKKFLIKSLKVLNTKNKKVWIGFDIEPSQEITGGIWCSNQEFDNNLVTVFSERCYEHISRQKYTSRKDLLLFARSLNLTQNSEIKEDDIQKILNILIFDNKIEPIFPESFIIGNKYSILLSKNDNLLNLIKYQKCKEYKTKSIFDCIPCSICPVIEECSLKNIVNPFDCPHLKKFINGDLNNK